VVLSSSSLTHHCFVAPAKPEKLISQLHDPARPEKTTSELVVPENFEKTISEPCVPEKSEKTISEPIELSLTDAGLVLRALVA